MALITCPECGNKVSDKSKMCVHCGFPIDSKEMPTIVKIKCSYCGRITTGYEENCEGCGADLSQEKVYIRKRPKAVVKVDNNPDRRICPECGKIIPVFEEYCVSCYKKKYEVKPEEDAITEEDIEKKPKNKWIAFLLCFFFGFYGVHKFYEGKIGMGILYLLTAGLFGIGCIVDMVIILCKPNPYYIE